MSNGYFRGEFRNLFSGSLQMLLQLALDDDPARKAVKTCPDRAVLLPLRACHGGANFAPTADELRPATDPPRWLDKGNLRPRAPLAAPEGHSTIESNR